MNPLDLFSNYTFAQALYGTVAIGVVAGAVGPLAFLRRSSLIADCIAHASLPGLLIAFLLAGRLLPAMMVGAMAVGLVAVALVHALPRFGLVRVDASMAATLSTFFALGMMLLHYIAHQPLPGKGGIADYLLGNASTLTRSDVHTILVAGGIALFALSLVHRVHAAVVCDTSFAISAGLPVALANTVAFAALVTVIVIGIKVVGVVLMVAVVIAPAAAARQLTHRLVSFIVCSAFLGGLAAAIGCYISVAYGPLPTGPVIVVVQAVIVVLALFYRKVVRA